MQLVAGRLELARAQPHAGQRPQHAAGDRPQPRALGLRPLGLGLVGQEVAAVEGGGARQRDLGARRVAGAQGVQPGLGGGGERVGVDQHAPETSS